MTRLKYLLALLREIGEFAAANKAWWLIPIALILLGVASIVTLGGSATPLIYTLF
ncbi:MAG: hypothetical protein JXA30_05340 [Deltaproteobacteria bacterium]|nr:hypothetical protein [Deltaproteobacteria bacterium]